VQSKCKHATQIVAEVVFFILLLRYLFVEALRVRDLGFEYLNVRTPTPYTEPRPS